MNKETAITLTGEQINSLLRKEKRNVDILDNPQPSRPHLVTIRGKVGDDSKTRFVFTSKSGIGTLPPSKYINTTMTLSNDKNKDGDGYHGVGKGRPYTVFEGTRPDLFNFLLEQITSKNYKSIGDPSSKTPQIELNQFLYGKKLTFIVPKYTPHIWNEDTNTMTAQTTTRKDPWTREPRTVSMVLVEYTRFYDEEELEGHVKKIIESEMENRVVPFLVETKSVEKSIAGIPTSTTHVESATAGDETETEVEYDENEEIISAENKKKTA